MKNLFFFKRIPLYLLVIGVVLSSSCGKKSGGNGDGANPDYYISFKADGVQKKYTGQAIASLGHSDQDGLYNGVIQGYKGAVNADKEHLGIVIFSNSAVAAGTYQDPGKAVNADGDGVPQATISYTDAAGNGYITLGLLVDKDGTINALPGSENIVADAKVSITKRTAAYIAGTFSGTVFLSTEADFKTRIVITEGKFILKAYSLD